jgi:ParB/RepB/Spo0J family partition protein
MKIHQIDVKKLIEYNNNPRNNEDAVNAVANSIKEFGFKVPIVIDKNNIIIAGHTRLLASKKLGIETVPCIIADDLTDKQIKAFRLADNKTAELASWDLSKLEKELLNIEIDMLQFGFDELEEMFPDNATDDDFDENEGISETPYSLPGDVYELNGHRLMCE